MPHSSSAYALTVRKPTTIVFDIVGTVTKTGVIEDVFVVYVRNNVAIYLANNWANPVVEKDVQLLRAQMANHSAPPPGGSPREMQACIADYVVKCLDQHQFDQAVRILMMHMLFDGFNRGKLKTSVYSDVADSLSKWNRDGIALFVLSNGYNYAMRKFLKHTSKHGDLTLLVKDFLDTRDGALNEPSTYERIVNQLGQNPEDVLFLTHSGVEGVAAHRAGLSVILVTTHRDDIHRERSNETERYGLPFLRTFNELRFNVDAPPASSMVDEVAASSVSGVGDVGRISSAHSGSKPSKGASSSKGGSSLSGSKSSSTAPTSSTNSSSASGSSSISDGSSKSKSGSKTGFSGSSRDTSKSNRH